MADLATAVTVLDANGRAGVPSLLISGPGMGKSSLVRGLAAADGVLCKTVLGSLREPSDFGDLSGCALLQERRGRFGCREGVVDHPRPRVNACALQVGLQTGGLEDRCGFSEGHE